MERKLILNEVLVQLLDNVAIITPNFDTHIDRSVLASCLQFCEHYFKGSYCCILNNCNPHSLDVVELARLVNQRQRLESLSSLCFSRSSLVAGSIQKALVNKPCDSFNSLPEAMEWSLSHLSPGELSG